MQFINDSVSFGPLSGSGPQTTSTTVSFPAPVSQAAAILTGFTAEYSGGDDHHLGQLDVKLHVDAINGSDVAIGVQLGLRDWSGTWDDRYDGQVFFTVIGD
jgi:hypothetical protein